MIVSKGLRLNASRLTPYRFKAYTLPQGHENGSPYAFAFKNFGVDKVQVDADYISSFDHCVIGVWTRYSLNIMTNECLTSCILVNRIMINE